MRREVNDTLCCSINSFSSLVCLVAAVMSELVVLIKYKTKQNEHIFQNVISWDLIQTINAIP